MQHGHCNICTSPGGTVIANVSICCLLGTLYTDPVSVITIIISMTMFMVLSS